MEIQHFEKNNKGLFFVRENGKRVAEMTYKRKEKREKRKEKREKREERREEKKRRFFEGREKKEIRLIVKKKEKIKKNT
jgi:hypothetical protein